MLAWMAFFGTVEHIGVECTGSYGAGLLHYLQNAGIKWKAVSVVKAIRSMQKVPLMLLS